MPVCKFIVEEYFRISLSRSFTALIMILIALSSSRCLAIEEIRYYDGFVIPMKSDETGDFEYDFDTGRLYLLSGDNRQLVGIEIDERYTDEEEGNEYVLINTPETLTDEERASIRSISLGTYGEWTPNYNPLIETMNMNNLCIALAAPLLEGDNLFPELPKDLRCLALAIHADDFLTSKDISSLPELKSLEYFAITGMAEFDISLLADLRENLKFLIMYAANIIHTDMLEEFSNLQTLGIGFIGFNDLSFISSLNHLEHLYISDTEVTDLEPLAHASELQTIDISNTLIEDLAPLAMLPKLRTINAQFTQISAIPTDKDSLPVLRRLDIMSAPVDEQALSAFSATHPDCLVFHGWKDLLMGALEGVDRVAIRDVSCGPEEGRGLLFEITDSREIKKFMSLIEIDEDESENYIYDACCGNPRFDFFHGNALLLTLSYHGYSLRWRGPAEPGWPWDAILEHNSSVNLKQYIADNTSSLSTECP